jgi:hypothetical protein
VSVVLVFYWSQPTPRKQIHLPTLPIPETHSIEIQANEIPHIIWTYWDKEEIPPLIEQCILSWKRHNPGYTINILSKQNLKQFLDEPILSYKLSNTPQRTSDFIRIHILTKYGGIWADASLLMTQSLDWIHNGSDVVVYSIDDIHDSKTYPVLENWFIASIPHCDFIQKWKDEFMNIHHFESGEEYLEDVKKRGANLSTIFCTPYLTMHVAAQFVLQKVGTTSALRVLNARTGPYAHMRFDTFPLTFKQSLYNLCHDPLSPIIKLRGIDREFIMDHPRESECVWELIKSINS